MLILLCVLVIAGSAHSDPLNNSTTESLCDQLNRPVSKMIECGSELGDLYRWGNLGPDFHNTSATWSDEEIKNFSCAVADSSTSPEVHDLLRRMVGRRKSGRAFRNVLGHLARIFTEHKKRINIAIRIMKIMKRSGFPTFPLVNVTAADIEAVLGDVEALEPPIRYKYTGPVNLRMLNVCIHWCRDNGGNLTDIMMESNSTAEFLKELTFGNAVSLNYTRRYIGICNKTKPYMADLICIHKHGLEMLQIMYDHGLMTLPESLVTTLTPSPVSTEAQTTDDPITDN